MKPLVTLALVVALLVGGTASASPFSTAATKVATVAAHVSAGVTKAQLGAFGLGLGAGIYVTQKLHKSTGFWAKRIPGTRYRMADLPVGGALALGGAYLSRHDPALSHIFLAASAGMTAGAVGTGLADPLPSASNGATTSAAK